jgi:hypothetical protein
MIIDRNITKYIVYCEDPIINALRRISENKSGVIVSVSESGKVEGVLTDGDFRRWIVQQKDIDLNLPVSSISNKQFRWVLQSEKPEVIEGQFDNRIHFLPILDAQHHLVGIARDSTSDIRIGERVIGGDAPCFVIAEIGNNHNGSLELAKQLVDLAADAGADCAKFQMRNLGSLYRDAREAKETGEDLGSEYTLDLLERFQLRDDELFEAFDYCRARGIIPLCTPWDIASVEQLEKYGIQAYKVASADLTNHDLLASLGNTRKPLIVSTGMIASDWKLPDRILRSRARLRGADRSGGAGSQGHRKALHPGPKHGGQ